MINEQGHKRNGTQQNNTKGCSKFVVKQSDVRKGGKNRKNRTGQMLRDEHTEYIQ